MMLTRNIIIGGSHEGAKQIAPTPLADGKACLDPLRSVQFSTTRIGAYPEDEVRYLRVALERREHS
jgi:hypothetical protein